MRHAPPVGVNLSCGGLWRLGGMLLAALAAGVCTFWLLQHMGWSVWPAAPVVVMAALAAALALRRGLRQPPVQLRWDGVAWAADGQAGELDLMLDLQRWLLLHWRPQSAGQVLWLPVPASEAGASWHGLRAALYSRAAFSPSPVDAPGAGPTD